MTLHTQGIVYRPLADVTIDITVETVVVWRREESSPLVQEFLGVVREVLGQRKETTADSEEKETAGKGANQTYPRKN